MKTQSVRRAPTLRGRDLSASAVELRVAAQSDTTLELRGDSETGPLLGMCALTATGGAWATQTCQLTETSGVGRVFVSFGGAARLNWLKFQPVGGDAGTGGTHGGGSSGGAGAGGAGGRIVLSGTAGGGGGSTGAGGSTGVTGSGAGAGLVVAASMRAARSMAPCDARRNTFCVGAGRVFSKR